MQVRHFCISGSKVAVLPCLQAGNATWCISTAKGIFYCIQVEFDAGVGIFRKAGSMGYGLYKILALFYKNIFLSTVLD